MVTRNFITVVAGLLLMLQWTHSQNFKCTRNVRCSCGYTRGFGYQNRFCDTASRDPTCCTQDKIPPFTVPVSTQPRQVQFERRFRRNSLFLEDNDRPSMQTIPKGTGDNDRPSMQTSPKGTGEESSFVEELEPVLEHRRPTPTVAVPSPSAALANSTHEEVNAKVLSLSDQIVGVNGSLLNGTQDIPFNSRVLGGQQSSPLKNAWLVFITFEEVYRGVGHSICGGALISSLFVLTTAHCFYEDDGTKRTVKKIDLGRFDLKKFSEPGAFTRRERDHFIHPGYNRFDEHHVDDIALILMDDSSPIEGNGVFPIYLPRADESLSRFDELWARVAGWGGQGPHSKFNPQVRETCMQVKRQCCQNHFRQFLPSKQLCLFGSYDTDICAGDSGSPFVVQGYAGPTVIALVSLGTFQCGNNKPTINTAVQFYVPWIKNILSLYEPFYNLYQKRDISYVELTCDEFPCNY